MDPDEFYLRDGISIAHVSHVISLHCSGWSSPTTCRIRTRIGRNRPSSSRRLSRSRANLLVALARAHIYIRICIRLLPTFPSPATLHFSRNIEKANTHGRHRTDDDIRVRDTWKMANYHKPESKIIQELRDIATKLRIHSIQATQASKSG